MPAVSATHARPRVRDHAARWLPPVGAFLAGGGPIVLLGFSNGGYEVATVAGYGVALWWLVLVGFLTGALPRPALATAGWITVASLTALVLWGGASLGWSTDPERGLTEVSRLLVALGSLLLGSSAVRAGHGRVLAGGVLAGLSTVVTAAVLSRLQPDLVPAAGTTADALGTRERTSWPLNYWNAVGAAGALAIPLALGLAARARHTWTAALAAAPVPVLVLGIAFTLSRGAMVAAAIGVLALVAMVAPRPVVVRTLLGPAVGAVAVVTAAWRQPALVDATGGAAQTTAGGRVVAVLAVATAGVALLQAGWTTADRAWWTPRLPRPRGALAASAAAGAVVVALAVAVAAGAPQRVGDAWDDFRVPTVSQTVANAGGADRLSSLSGNGRYQVWAGAWRAATEHPLGGIGLGSWESWWNPRRGDTGFVRNAHSEAFELAAEVGVVGALLFLAVIVLPLLAAARSALRRRPLAPDAAVVGPALVAFAVSLLIDWNWQISAFAVAGMTLAAVPLARARGAASGSVAARAAARPERRSPVSRVAAIAAIAVAAVGAIGVFATALVAPQAVDASR
ncbi:O-antigen ligase family protein, partial [Patulibacter sp. S7RM1-6]